MRSPSLCVLCCLDELKRRQIYMENFGFRGRPETTSAEREVGLLKCGQGGVKDLADIRKLLLFLLFQHALQTLSIGDAYESISYYQGHREFPF